MGTARASGPSSRPGEQQRRCRGARGLWRQYRGRRGCKQPLRQTIRHTINLASGTMVVLKPGDDGACDPLIVSGALEHVLCAWAAGTRHRGLASHASAACQPSHGYRCSRRRRSGSPGSVARLAPAGAGRQINATTNVEDRCALPPSGCARADVRWACRLPPPPPPPFSAPSGGSWRTCTDLSGRRSP